MRRSKAVNYLLIFCVFLVSACGQQDGGNNKITIATAANMQFAMEELAKVFTKQSGVECELIIGSSGKLTAQIKEGAPYDVFVAANMKYPQELYNSKLTRTSPEIYAFGKLVLWSMVDDIDPSITLLTDKGIEHIALANPITSPYGVAATEALNYYRIYNKVEDQLVFGESVAQTNQFITSQSAEVGFTAMSVVVSPKMKGKGKWIEMGASTYTPIEQAVVVIKRQNEVNQLAMEFYKFLFTNEAKEILTNFGYGVDE
ncbi:MAG: molybdate ABC transporter substrate-binding protein [Bacteroidetes bacterium]|nr:molybdate ABC transporter substrate-binding protein [Bacteroidota bacterium]